MRPELETRLHSLLTCQQDVLELDEVAEAIGALDVTYEEIDCFISALEAAGKRVGKPDAAPASAALSPTLQAARKLRAELGRTPSIAQIAEAAELTTDEVRRALLFVQILQR